MALFRSGIRQWRTILWLAVPGFFASYLGTTMSITVNEAILTRILGGFLLVYVLFILFKSEWKLTQHHLTAGVGGLLSGFAAGIFGVGGAIRGVFLSAFNLRKEVYLFTSGAIALVIDTTRIAGYLDGGDRIEGVFLWGLLLFITVSLLGAWTASRFVDRVPQGRFRLYIALFLAAVALRYLLVP